MSCGKQGMAMAHRTESQDHRLRNYLALGTALTLKIKATEPGLLIQIQAARLQ